MQVGCSAMHGKIDRDETIKEIRRPVPRNLADAREAAPLSRYALDVKDKGSVTWNVRRGASAAVALGWRANDSSLATWHHACNANIPSFDHLANAELE